MGDKFEYNYKAPSLEERKEIESIRRQYLPKSDHLGELEMLKKLDGKVKNLPIAISLSVGIIGLLFFGLAMTFFLEWQHLWYLGIPSGVVGIILMLAAYPIYNKLLLKLKNKYGSTIIDLSNRLLNKDN